jgi:N-acetylglucosaminyl-diphospho-decaprenol L-rhamnosyltransferase
LLLNPQTVDFSLVSHGHGVMVRQSLSSLANSLRHSGLNARVLLTLNLPEPDLEAQLSTQPWPFELVFLRNSHPLGFGANHNRAFLQSQAAWFAVINPDVLWPQDEAFWHPLSQDTWPPRVGLICPEQLNAQGQRQDYARRLITPLQLLTRVARRLMGAAPSRQALGLNQADWVNGACLFFRTQVFASLQGFDERYFMYCEDTDICLRLQLAGWSIGALQGSVVHDAQRDTGRKWRHLAWHVRSLWRLWRSDAYRQFKRRSH